MTFLIPQELKLLFFLGLILLFMVGVVKGKRLLAFLAGLIWVPMALGIGGQFIRDMWTTLPREQSLLILGIGIP
ncbi:MAG: hypothetical protein AAF513_12715, partial [Pseudomonadota bacterium]